MIRLFIRKLIVTMAISVMVTGCLYPQERLTGGMEALPKHVEDVQAAIDRFYEQKSVLPIKTVDNDTPLYQKYVIDFEQLVPVYLPDAPPSSFEKGGSYLYVLIDVEDNPTVKLFDIRVSDAIQPVQLEVNEAFVKLERFPRGFEISPGVFELNADIIKTADTTVPSPYFPDRELPLVMDSHGIVYVDYRMDLLRLIQEKNITPPTEQDIRYLLTEQSLFVPAHSLPYIYENGDVVFAPDQ